MNFEFSLGDLADPKKYHSSLNIDGFEEEELHGFAKSILNIRTAEYKLAETEKMAALVALFIWEWDKKPLLLGFPVI